MEIRALNPEFRDIFINNTAQKTDAKTAFPLTILKYYELDYITSSYGRIIINNKEYLLRENDFFLRKPGQTVQGFMPYRFKYLIFGVEDSGSREFLDSLPDKINAGQNKKVPVLFEEILSLSISGKPINQLLIKARILELLYEYHNGIITERYNKHIKKAVKFIDKNFGENIDIPLLCETLEISETYLYRIFKKDLGTTPVKYLNSIRIEKSKPMLINSDKSIGETAALCGFGSISYYSYLFKKQEKISPREFREKYLI